MIEFVCIFKCLVSSVWCQVTSIWCQVPSVWCQCLLGDVGGDRIECSLLLMIGISDGILCIGDDGE